jgi:GPI inositol-deacylase
LKGIFFPMKGQSPASSEDADADLDVRAAPATPPEADSLEDDATPPRGRCRHDTPLSLSSARSRRSTNANYGRNGAADHHLLGASKEELAGRETTASASASRQLPRLCRGLHGSTWRGPWSITVRIFLAAVVGLTILATILNSLVTRQLDLGGCQVPRMGPTYRRFDDFDTEHTRFASKYSLYLYREHGIDDWRKVCAPSRGTKAASG